ncbi:unnamed protein product [Enterobius vermicularis]|uniref:Fibrinogen C-terminal domain-containing protein n=1 Tax=Enterobius vermicularis TaxID=51028 RepID=A0A0N4VCJ1_ENTVE|nr:unnamed protein product [Enterobius vermicularis]
MFFVSFVADYSRIKRARYNFGNRYNVLSDTFGGEFDNYYSPMTSDDEIPVRHNRDHYYRYNALLKKPTIGMRLVRPRLF